MSSLVNPFRPRLRSPDVCVLGVLRGRVGATVLAVVLAGLVAGCSQDREDGQLTVDDLVELPPEEEHQQFWLQNEEHIRDCMAEEGFEYIPHVQPRFTANSGNALIRGALMSSGDREWVQTYGYGLAAGVIESDEFFDSDPNRDIRGALAQAEAVQYHETHGRCSIEAREAAGRDDHYLDLSAQVVVLLAELETEIVSDPRLAEVTQRWATCMNERGHSFRTLSDPRDEVLNRWSSFVPDESAAPEAERAHRDAFYARLLEEELELAVDDLDCREESEVADVLVEVMEEAEAEFVDRNTELLAEYQAIRTGS